MLNVTLSTDGTWDNTQLFVNGNLAAALKLQISLTTMSKEFGEGGLGHGGQMSAAYWTEDPANPDNLIEHALFPGTFNLQVMQGSTKTWDLQVLNLTHALDFLATQVLIDGVDATPAITRLEILFDYPKDNVEVWYEIQSQDNGLISKYDEVNIF